MIQLSEHEKSKIYRLNEDKIALEGLKKVFLNAVVSSEPRQEVHTLAAERLAIEYIKFAFKELARIKPVEQQEGNKENPAF